MSPPDTRLLVLVPAYRAAESLRRLIPRLRAQLDADLLVVDDGSEDGTPEIIAQAGIADIRHSTNLGKGAALRSGFLWAHEHDYEWILTMDADGQHQPEDALALWRQAGTGKVLIGNRMKEANAMPLLRRWTNRLMSAWISRRLRQSIPDSQCGLRLYHRTCLPIQPTVSSRFAAETEHLFQVDQRGFPIVSVPVACRYLSGKSHIRPVRDTVLFLRSMVHPGETPEPV